MVARPLRLQPSNGVFFDLLALSCICGLGGATSFSSATEVGADSIVLPATSASVRPLRLASVDHVDAMHARFDRADGALHLGQHPALDYAFLLTQLGIAA